MDASREAVMFDLTDYLPYLLNRTGSRIAGAFTEVLRPYGINLQQWRVLAALHHRDGQRMTELAATTSIDVSTLSRLVGGMEGKGLCARRRGAGGRDARVVSVHVTPAGEALTEELIPLAKHYENVAVDGLTDDEMRALKSLLIRVYDNLEQLENTGKAQEAAKPADAA